MAPSVARQVIAQQSVGRQANDCIRREAPRGAYGQLRRDLQAPGVSLRGTTLHRYVLLYNQQLPQSALGSKTPLQAMKDWRNLKPELFKKQLYHLPGCDRDLVPRRGALL